MNMLDQITTQGDTHDLISVIRLTAMNETTRAGTIQSVRAFRDAVSGGQETSVDAFISALAAVDPSLRAALGDRHSQILSDCRRAERAWQNVPRRRLAIRLRGQIPTLEDAKAAAVIAFSTDKAVRVATAIDRLASAHSNLAATSIVVEPLLRAARPETFNVRAGKSLENCKWYIRAAVALVDPNALSSRIADTIVLSPSWRHLLAVLKENTPDHAHAVRAIHARISIRAHHAGHAPTTTPPDFFQEFVEHERATKAASHDEKLRMASRIWNSCLATGELEASPFEIASRVLRLPVVRWCAVPDAIRNPLDALMCDMEGAADQSWSALIPTGAMSTDADLGMADLDQEFEEQADARVAGTLKNWQDAVKRTWHASANDPAVLSKPTDLAGLFQKDCIIAVIRAIRGARRIKIEAAGGKWEGKEKGRYETSLLQALLAVGRAVSIDDEQLQRIREITYKIDPSVVGSKLLPDGSRKLIYEARRIGPRHSGMLREFSEITVLGRWLNAPATLTAVLSGKARARKAGSAPTLAEAALARTNLIAQLSQRVSPCRRSNIARLRFKGETPHLQLPVGRGEGKLFFPACEMKNLRAVTVSIDPGTVEMIKTFIRIYHPVCAANAKADPENEHLFPGAESYRKETGSDGGYAPGFGYITRTKLNTTFGKHMLRYCMLHIDLHVMRHLAGKIILDQDPSAMSLVQEILGHKKIETTRAYYAEVCQLVAQRRYLDLLDKATRKAIMKVSFTIELQKELN